MFPGFFPFHTELLGGAGSGYPCACQGYAMGCKKKKRKKKKQPQNKSKIHLPGIHYVGQMQEGSTIRVVVDQLTEGQLEWARLPAVYDAVVLGEPGRGRTYRIYSGKEEYFQGLKEQFPGEGAAIEEFQWLVKVGEALASPQRWDRGMFLALVPLCGVTRGGEIPPPRHSGMGQLQRIMAWHNPPPKALGNMSKKISLFCLENPVSHPEF